MPTAPKAFDAHAGDYDALRRRLVAVFDALYEEAIEALSRAPARASGVWVWGTPP